MAESRRLGGGHPVFAKAMLDALRGSSDVREGEMVFGSLGEAA